ncbi:hypothetical protein I7I48_02185 [Histoplasma ohiense]|nr:hypothetical protein I7I48_02185 [Histoplasma ohiense (nom. inval.)]
MVCMMAVMGDSSYIDIDASPGVVGERGLAWKGYIICLCLCLCLFFDDVVIVISQGWDLGFGLM